HSLEPQLLGVRRSHVPRRELVQKTAERCARPFSGNDGIDATYALFSTQLDEELDVAAERGLGRVRRAGPNPGVKPGIGDVDLRMQPCERGPLFLLGFCKWAQLEHP